MNTPARVAIARTEEKHRTIDRVEALVAEAINHLGGMSVGGRGEFVGYDYLPAELHFELHLREGPYIVFDDAAKPEYKNDPLVHLVPALLVSALARFEKKSA